MEARSLAPHPGSDWPLALGGAGLQIWTMIVAGKAFQGNSYRAVIGFYRKRLLRGLAAQNAIRTRVPASFLG